MAAVATDVLARPKIERAGLLGSSHQARALLTCLSRVRALPQVRVYSTTATNRASFAAAMSRELGLDVQPVDAPEAVIQECDLVGSAIRAGSTPVLGGAGLAAGTHVNALSAVRPEARELDDAVWRRSDVAVVDDRVHAFESGDGQSALRSGAVRMEDVAELWEVLAGKRPGRQRDQDVTLFKAVGTAVQDLTLAAALYERARARGLGAELGAFPHLRGF
jgi:ornithine cyclodeaminase/alanine dehydrogenase-like protein (mu-crystallin family)